MASYFLLLSSILAFHDYFIFFLLQNNMLLYILKKRFPGQVVYMHGRQAALFKSLSDITKILVGNWSNVYTKHVYRMLIQNHNSSQHFPWPISIWAHPFYVSLSYKLASYFCFVEKGIRTPRKRAPQTEFLVTGFKVIHLHRFCIVCGSSLNPL